MEFLSNLSEKTFLEFVKTYEDQYFLQTNAWLRAGMMNGDYQGYYVGVLKDGQIVGVSLVLVYRQLKLTMAYTPRGPLLDYNQKELVIFFVDQLKKFAKDLRVDFLRIEPPFIYQKRDFHFNILETNEIDILNTLSSQKMKHSGFYEGFRGAQPRYSIFKNLSNDFRQDYNKNVLRTIKRNQNFNLTLKQGQISDLTQLIRLRTQLANQKHFIIKDLPYWEMFYQVLEMNQQVDYFLLTVKPKKTIDYLLMQNKLKEDLIEQHEGNRRKKGLVNDCKDTIRLNNQLIDEFKALKQDEEVVVGCSLNFIKDKQVQNFIAHTDKTLTKANIAQSLYDLQFEHYSKLGYACFDLFGIPGQVENTNSDYGLYASKIRYGGVMVEYIGYFEYPVHKLKYGIIHLIRKIRAK